MTPDYRTFDPVHQFLFELRDLIIKGRASIGQGRRGAFGRVLCLWCEAPVVVGYHPEAADGCIPYESELCGHGTELVAMWLLARKFADSRQVAGRDACPTCDGTGLAA